MTYKEALEEIARQNKSDEWYPGGDYLDGYDALIDIAREAIASDYQEPDDNTPDDAAVWTRNVFGKKKSRWCLSRMEAVRRFALSYAQTVLAKENQGPPPTDWTPGGK